MSKMIFLLTALIISNSLFAVSSLNSTPTKEVHHREIISKTDEFDCTIKYIFNYVELSNEPKKEYINLATYQKCIFDAVEMWWEALRLKEEDLGLPSTPHPYPNLDPKPDPVPSMFDKYYDPMASIIAQGLLSLQKINQASLSAEKKISLAIDVARSRIQFDTKRAKQKDQALEKTSAQFIQDLENRLNQMGDELEKGNQALREDIENLQQLEKPPISQHNILSRSFNASDIQKDLEKNLDPKDLHPDMILLTDAARKIYAEKYGINPVNGLSNDIKHEEGKNDEFENTKIRKGNQYILKQAGLFALKNTTASRSIGKELLREAQKNRLSEEGFLDEDNDEPSQTLDRVQNFTQKLDRVDQKHQVIKEFIQSMDIGYPRERAQNALAISTFAKEVGKNEFYSGALIEGETSLTIAEEIADVALCLTPGVSIGKDAYELFVGKNLVTGVALSEFERSIAFVGVITLGTSNYIKVPVKVLVKVLKKINIRLIDKGIRLAKTAFSSIVNIGPPIPPSARKSLGSAADVTIGFSKGTGQFLFHNMGRVNHASRHLTDARLLPNWSKSTYESFKKMGQNILENPLKTFDHKLGEKIVKGFHGKVEGKDVVFFHFQGR